MLVELLNEARGLRHRSARAFSLRSIEVEALPEIMVIDNALATAAVKECWKHRIQALKKELGSEGAPLLE